MNYKTIPSCQALFNLASTRLLRVRSVNSTILAAVSFLAFASFATPKAAAQHLVTGLFDGGQNFTANWINGTVGQLVTVGASDLTVTSLGFNDYQQNGFSNPAGHQVGIWSTGPGNSLLGSVTLATGASGTLIQEWCFADLAAPITLSAGASYFIGASTTTDDGDLWFGSNGPGVAPNFTYASDFTGTPGLFFRNDGTFAAPLDGTGVLGYAVNMQYTVAVVPEPQVGLLAIMGLAGMFLGVRRNGSTSSHKLVD